MSQGGGLADSLLSDQELAHSINTSTSWGTCTGLRDGCYNIVAAGVVDWELDPPTPNPLKTEIVLALTLCTQGLKRFTKAIPKCVN